MERIEVEAVYEKGTLKLPHLLPLQEGEKVTVTIHPAPARKHRGLIQWKGSLEDLDYLILSPDNDLLEEP